MAGQAEECVNLKGSIPKWCTEHITVVCFAGSLMILFTRDNCGPIKMNKTYTSIRLEIRQKSQAPRQCPVADDAQVGDRELQATEINKRTRTTAMTPQVHIGSLRAASITWSTET